MPEVSYCKCPMVISERVTDFVNRRRSATEKGECRRSAEQEGGYDPTLLFVASGDNKNNTEVASKDEEGQKFQQQSTTRKVFDRKTYRKDSDT